MRFLSAAHERVLANIGLFGFRIAVGGAMIYGHGWKKLVGFSDIAPHFPDPLGVGSTASLALAVFGEFVCSALLIFGLATRLAAIPFVITMLVAALIVHSGDPWKTRELAVVYAICGSALICIGAGDYSVDGWIKRLSA